MHTAIQGGEAERLFKEGVLSTIKHNKRLRKNILHSIHPFFITTDSGIITGKAAAVPWDNETHNFTIERIVKGLFFHHYNKIVPADIHIKTYWFKQMPLIDRHIYYTNSIADGNFIYCYNKVEETDFDSVWLFSFYGGHFAGGIILNKPQEMTK